MDAVVLLESSQCREYFQHVFEPHKEYVPVQEDFSDLVQQLNRTVQSGEGRAIAQRWRAKGYRVLSLPCVLAYAEQLLRRYASLLRFTPAPLPGTVAYALNMTLDDITSARATPDEIECARFLRS